MAFSLRNLSVTAYANGYTSWCYRGVSSATIAEVQADGFFNPSADMLNPGDTIMCSCRDGGVLLYVDAAEGGVKARPMCGTVS